MEKILKELFEYSTAFKEKIGKLKKAEGLDAKIIWQYVRFNPNYQTAFSEATALAATMSDEYAPDIFNDLGSAWSLYPYAVDPSDAILPEEFYFEVKANVRSFDIQKFLGQKAKRDAFWERLSPPHAKNYLQPPNQLLITLNPMADNFDILAEIEDLIKTAKSKFLIYATDPAAVSLTLRGRGTTNLIDNLCAFYVTEKLDVTAAKTVTEKMGEILGPQRTEPFQNQHIDRMVEQFKKTSAISPWCFFLKPN